MRKPRWRSVCAVATVATLVPLATGALLTGAVAGPVAAASGSAKPDLSGQLRNERARAAAIEARIQALGDELDLLSQEYDELEIRSQVLARQEAAAARQAAIDSGHARSARTLVADLAVQQWESGSTALTAMSTLLDFGQANYGLEVEYLQAAGAHEQQVVRSWRVAERTLLAVDRHLAAERAGLRRLATQLSEKAAAANRAQAEERQTLSQVTGRVAELVHEIVLAEIAAREAAARRRQEEIAAAAAAAAARQRQEELAAAAAAAAAARQRQEQQAAAAAAQRRADATTTTAPPPTEPPVTDPPVTTPPPAGPPLPPPVAGSPPPPLASASVAVSTALAQVGKPYLWGAAGPNAFDCSGLTMFAWAAAGIQLEHYTVAQLQETYPITQAELEPGDLVFYSPPMDYPIVPGHVAMYIGNGDVVSANSAGTFVQTQSIYYDGIPSSFGRVTASS
jgi:cell wall-associated NlpC family hydrolase